MVNWVVAPEWIALVITVVVFIYSLQEHTVIVLRTRTFQISLFITFLCIALDIASIRMMQDPSIAMFAQYCVNAIGFVFTFLMIASVTVYALTLIFEDRYDQTAFRASLIVEIVVAFLFVGVAITNEKTHLLFYFDQAGNYHRGVGNKTPYIFAMISILIVACVFLSERRRVNRAFRKGLAMVVPSVVALATYQLMSPETLLSGAIAIITLLVFFINAQQQRIDTDHLTELGSREAFYRTLQIFVSQQKLFHVIFVSLRNYKQINNQFGQRAGDGFLHGIGQFLQALRKDAIAFRFSGVEFALILRNIDETDYENCLASLQARFLRPWVYDGNIAAIRAAVADISYPAHAHTVNNLIESLEYAVRRSKIASEYNAPVRFNATLAKELGRRNYVIHLLSNANDTDRFFLNFQPIYDCRRQRFTGAEVLLRMRDRNGAVISPGEFIPLAEENGMIEQISWMVLEKACRFLRDHREEDLEWLSVNICAREYRNLDVVNRLRRLLSWYGVPASRLKLEITERLLVEDMELARTITEELLGMGVGTCLDDFGTGYSNLANVTSLQFEYIKVDKSLVNDITENGRAKSLLHSVVTAFQSMGMQVLVEGVETAEQVEILKELAADMIQGFYYAKPMDENAFLDCIERQAAKTVEERAR